jgi:cell wall-associated NlpC family hydrolase
MPFTSILKAAAYRAEAVAYLKRWMFVPYRWGGDDPLAGIDCSGLVMEILKAVGLAGEKDDLTAGGILEKFKANIVYRPYAGVLVFWKKPDGSIPHVGMMIDDMFIVHAASGDSTTTDMESAIAKNAYVKMRELESYARARLQAYGQSVVFADPFKIG